jgi:hypothetical protein
MRQESIFVPLKQEPRLHQRMCRRCLKVYIGTAQSKYCKACYKPCGNKASRVRE